MVGAWSGGMSAPGGLVRGVSAPGGCLVQGGVLSGEFVYQHALRQTPLPPVDRHTLVKILP